MAYPTNPIYKLYKSPMTGQDISVSKQVGNHVLSIPFDNDNADYQEYLAWVAEGNTAEASD